MNLRGLLHSRLRKRRPSDSAVTPSGREEGSLVQVKEGTGEPSDEQVIIGAVSPSSAVICMKLLVSVSLPSLWTIRAVGASVKIMDLMSHTT